MVFNEHGQFHGEFRPPISDKTNLIDSKNESFLPLNIALNKSHVFVTDDWTAGNCVRIFCKKNKNLIRNISNLEVYNPCGLLIDKVNNFLYTLGHLYYENGSLHLFCFDLSNNQENNLVRKIDLTVNADIKDMALDTVNCTLYCTGEKQLQVFKF